MDHEPIVVRVPSPPSRWPRTFVLAAAIFVAFAILKPWSPGGDATGEFASRPTASAVTAPASGRDPSVAPAAPTTAAIWDPNAMACMSSEGDRLLALQRSDAQEVRTWLVLDPAAIGDPQAGAATPMRLLSTHVVGLGICGKRTVQSDGIASAAMIVDVKAVSASSPPTLADLGAPGVVTRQLGVPYLGVLYGPPADLVAASPRASAPGETWPVGSYAIGFRFATDGPAIVRWVRLDIVPAFGRYD